MGMQTGSSQQSSSGMSEALSQQSIWSGTGTGIQHMANGATALLNQQKAAVPGVAAGVGRQTMPAALAGLQQMQQFANPNSALARRQLANVSADIGQNFDREILPGIRTGAGVGGNMGSSREALAKGVAAGDAARAIGAAGTDIYSNIWNMAKDAAGALPGMAQNVFNLGMAPTAAAWAPYQAAASV